MNPGSFHPLAPARWLQYVGGTWDAGCAWGFGGRQMLPLPRSDGMATLPPEWWDCYEERDGKMVWVATVDKPVWPTPEPGS